MRQEKIIEIVEKNQPITGESIAEKLQLKRSTLRPDLAVLTMCGVLDAKPKVGYFISLKRNEINLTDTLCNIKVKDIKSLPIVVSEETSIYDTIVMLFLENVGTIFVANDNKLKGVVSRKDLLKAAMGSLSINDMPVGVIMTRASKIVYCFPEDNIIEAAEKIIDNDIDCIPIVEINENNEILVTGRVSKTNMTKVIIEIAKGL